MGTMSGIRSGFIDTAGCRALSSVLLASASDDGKTVASTPALILTSTCE